MKKGVRWRYLARAPGILADMLLRGRYEFTYDLMPFAATDMSWAKRLNLLRAGLNLLYRRGRPWSRPIHTQIELTNYCNLQCPVCPTGTGRLDRGRGAMDLDLLQRVVDEVGPYLLTAALWAWGEPLLHPRLADTLRIATGGPFSTLLSTNGQNLNDPAVLDALLEYPPTYLIVAVDGLTNETNSHYRVGGSLEPALEGVRSLAARKGRNGQAEPVLHMRYIVTRQNQHELPRVEEFARENGFDALSIRTLSIIDAPETDHRELVPDREVFQAYEYADGRRVAREDFVCQLAFCVPTVLVDGTVVACDQDFNAQAAYGRLGAGASFDDIWFSREARRVRRRIKKHPETLSFCRNCPYADRRTNSCSVRWVDLRSEPAATS
jgi:radical SAM protein with 4Fe4S-binding SPASM domain